MTKARHLSRNLALSGLFSVSRRGLDRGRQYPWERGETAQGEGGKQETMEGNAPPLQYSRDHL